MRHPLALLTALAALALPVSGGSSKPQPDTSGFFDDFTRGLDLARWYVSDGWTNGDWQDCHWSEDAVHLADGKVTLLHIPAQKGADTPPLCGEIQTRARLHYGTFEARIRTPRAPGLNAAIFTYIGPVHDAPHDEIDIEILTRDPGAMTMNTYVAGKPYNGGKTPATPPFDAEFHTVAFRWEPDSITWFLDGKEVHRTQPEAPLPTHPQKLYLSLWSTTTLTDWMGKQKPQRGPLGYGIDWVAYTPLGQACLFQGSVTC